MHLRTHRRVRMLLAVGTGLAVVVLAGCASSGAGSPRSSAGSSAVVKDIAVTYKGGQIDPPPGKIAVPVGTHVHITVSSDVAEEVHNHYNDKEVAVPAGGTATFDFVASMPGVYEVELHRANKVLMQLQVG